MNFQKIHENLLKSIKNQQKSNLFRPCEEYYWRINKNQTFFDPARNITGGSTKIKLFSPLRGILPADQNMLKGNLARLGLW